MWKDLTIVTKKVFLMKFSIEFIYFFKINKPVLEIKNKFLSCLDFFSSNYMHNFPL